MSSCAANSFVPGTSVLMADGAKKEIEKIELGDLVLATDPETGTSSARPVVATITGTGVKDLVTVSVTDGSGRTGQVTATAGHPFWVPDIEEWVDAGELRPGMWVQTSSGTWVQVTAIEHDHREQTVHNLTIDTTHTYSVYAGADDAILTHNCGTGATSSGSYVDLASSTRRDHILNGEVRPNGTFGGGHRPGTGYPGKSEFPQGWTDDQIMHEISDIATDPLLAWSPRSGTGDYWVDGTRGGVDIQVLIRRNEIWTAYPTNVPRNP